MNADALLHWLLRTTIEASLLIMAVLGLRLMLGARLSPAWRIGLWLLVGTKLMLPAFIPAGFGLGALMQNETPPAIAQTADSSAIKHAAETSIPSSTSAPSRAPGIRHSSFDIRHSLLALWFTGSALTIAAALYRQRRFNLALRHRPLATAPLLRALVASLSQKAGIHRSVRILLMPAGTTPAVVGIAHPSILLPEDCESRFDEHSLRHVLLHELLHVKQHDLIWNWAANAVQALHWFNPLVWFVVSRFQADRELRCDAGALALLSPAERLDYGHTLLRIQETFFAPSAIAGLAPCVRNHPTLRQRIHMIAHPTARQPMLQLLLVITLSTLVCYSFTTARAVEKEVPAKERSRDGARTPAAEESKTTPSEEGTPARTKKPAAGEGDGGTKKPGMREGDGGTKKPGARDVEGKAKKPSTGEGDGGTKKPGMRDGEGGAKKPGTRDGDSGVKKPGTGERDGEGGKKPEARDRDKTANSGETITLRVIKSGEAVMVGETEVSMGGLRGHLSTFLPERPGAKVVVTGEGNVPMSAMNNAVDAVRDNGNKNVGIRAE